MPEWLLWLGRYGSGRWGGGGFCGFGLVVFLGLLLSRIFLVLVLFGDLVDIGLRDFGSRGSGILNLGRELAVAEMGWTGVEKVADVDCC